jgi:hypothetical protein
MAHQMRTRAAALAAWSVVLATVGSVSAQVQKADPDFDAKVARPAFTDKHPRVLFDEAHFNFHTAAGRYKPFVDLITNDGYRVTPNKEPLTAKSLAACDLLVIANALGAAKMNDPKASAAAFSEAECDAVRDWVRGGGSLLLIADHLPMGAAAERLGQRFGIHMSKGYTADKSHHDKTGGPSWLVFSRENKLLGDHPIVRGREAAESLKRVTTFTGQSLKGPEGSVAFLKLADSAFDFSLPDRKEVSAAGRAQGIALRLGKGRVVALGEAAVLTSQLVQLPGQQPRRPGMAFPGSDNRQLALNIVHWLSGLLD